MRGLSRNRNDTTVLAVLLEDGVALFGILLTLLVAGIGYVSGPQPGFDSMVAIVVGVVLGAMAIFLAAINRRVLIDASDQDLDRAAEVWLAERGVHATVRSLVLDNDRAVAFVRAQRDVAQSHAVGEAMKEAMREAAGKRVDQVYWKFATADAAAKSVAGKNRV
jgi:divalent metal cation (Fe/Co/Zn/Cd) transporter